MCDCIKLIELSRKKSSAMRSRRQDPDALCVLEPSRCRDLEDGLVSQPRNSEGAKLGGGETLEETNAVRSGW